MINQFKSKIRRVADKSLIPVKMVKDIKIRYFDFGLPKYLGKTKDEKIHNLREVDEITFLKFKLKLN